MNAPLRSLIGCSVRDIKEQAFEKGYARIEDTEFKLSPDLESAFEDFVYQSLFLPVDPTSKDANRFRRHLSFTLVPWRGVIYPNPTVWDANAHACLSNYSQPLSLNPQDGGRPRWFSALTGQQAANPFLEAQIWFDFQNSPLSDEERGCVIRTNVHLVQTKARPGKPAVASPNVVHRDGEPVTWVHLLERNNVSGGENFITDPTYAGRQIRDVPPSGIKDQFVLEKPLEAYVVRDDLVAHSVEAVHVAPGMSEGWRTVLLIDFTPMRPQILV